MQRLFSQSESNVQNEHTTMNWILNIEYWFQIKCLRMQFVLDSFSKLNLFTALKTQWKQNLNTKWYALEWFLSIISTTTCAMQMSKIFFPKSNDGNFMENSTPRCQSRRSVNICIESGKLAIGNWFKLTLSLNKTEKAKKYCVCVSFI